MTAPRIIALDTSSDHIEVEAGSVMVAGPIAAVLDLLDTPSALRSVLDDDDALFASNGKRSRKVHCRVCGRDGYPGCPWQEPHRRGHAPCQDCGKMLTVTVSGAPRRHRGCKVERLRDAA